MGNRREDLPPPAAKHLRATSGTPPTPLAPLPTGVAELDALLPGGGLARGAVTELMAPRGLGLSTALALSLCAEAQRQGKEGGVVPWCAFLDPTRSLHAAGVGACGVDLDHLLVVRPPADAVGRTALRLASSRLFAVLVVDTGGLPGAMIADSLGPWVALARRLATATEGASTATLLLTHREMGRPLPLPVTDCIELTQERPGRLLLRHLRHRYNLPSEWSACSLPLREPGVAAAIEAS